MAFTPKTVKMSPSQFVTDMTTNGIVVEDYLTSSRSFTDRFPNLPIHNYLCGNPNMSAANSAHFAVASKFWQALASNPQINVPYGNETAIYQAAIEDAIKGAKDKEKARAKLGTPHHLSNFTKQFGNVAKGQGYPIDFETMLECAWFNKDTYVKNPTLRPYLDVPTIRDFLAKVDADNIVGWDCIGFVHQYLYAVGVVDTYLGYSALGYLTQFKPIASLSEIEPLCVCAWSNDSHLIIIDKVHSISANEALIDISQSSGAVKTSKLIKVTNTSKVLDGDRSTPDVNEPFVFWGSRVGNPKVFLLDGGGQIPISPYVVIGKLPGLKLAAGGDASASN